MVSALLETDFLPPTAAAAEGVAKANELLLVVPLVLLRPARPSDAAAAAADPFLAAGVLIAPPPPPAPAMAEGSYVALLALPPPLRRPPRDLPPVLLPAGLVVALNVPLLFMLVVVLLRFASLDRYAISSAAAPVDTDPATPDEAAGSEADAGGGEFAEGGLMVRERYVVLLCHDTIIFRRQKANGTFLRGFAA